MQGPIPITNSNIPSGDPDLLFARALQQALGGVEDEIRLAMQTSSRHVAPKIPNSVAS